MSTRPKRALRNGHTCPTVPNPLSSPLTPPQIQEMLPPGLRSQLRAQHLTCAQIVTLPPSPFPTCPEEALARMQAAREWQSGGVEGGVKVEECEFQQWKGS
jgi:hypothetical protein